MKRRIVLELTDLEARALEHGIRHALRTEWSESAAPGPNPVWARFIRAAERATKKLGRVLDERLGAE
jgi:hypothetical protein